MVQNYILPLRTGSVVYGYAIASDTGGALMSGRLLVDLYYNTLGECGSTLAVVK